jgi:phytoene dehydrogenase-like protein
VGRKETASIFPLSMATATIIGSGPNGLSAAIVLASAGLSTTVLERNSRIGGACSTGEITLPGYRHDLGSSVYPLGIASHFFRSLPVEIPWIVPAASCAHPLDDGTAVLLEHSVDDTIANLDSIDRPKYRSLIEPLATHFDEVVQDILGPVQHIPKHPFLLARFGLSALLPAALLAHSRFSGVPARALFAGIAAHSVLSLEAPASAAVALVLMAAGNTRGWPIVRGGAQALTDVLARHLESLGGRIETGCEVTQLPQNRPGPCRHPSVSFSQSPGPNCFRNIVENSNVFDTAPECSRSITLSVRPSLGPRRSVHALLPSTSEVRSRRL